VLNGAHIRYLTQLFTNVCGDLGATLAECTGEDDHVHLWSPSCFAASCGGAPLAIIK
jgi:REP element-mobilizing transposase RayT